MFLARSSQVVGGGGGGGLIELAGWWCSHPHRIRDEETEKEEEVARLAQAVAAKGECMA